jgi:hypothetical protein
MPHDHEAVQRVDFVFGLHKFENRLRRNPLRFRRTPRQGIRRLRARDRRQEKCD